MTLLPLTSYNLGGFWAAYRIKKLRKFVAVWIIVAVSFSIYDLLFYDDEYYESHHYSGADSVWAHLNPFELYLHYADNATDVFVYIVEDVAWYGIPAFFIRRWSEKWNQGFELS